MYVDGYANNALIDIGATLSVMSYELYRKIRYKKHRVLKPWTSKALLLTNNRLFLEESQPSHFAANQKKPSTRDSGRKDSNPEGQNWKPDRETLRRRTSWTWASGNLKNPGTKSRGERCPWHEERT